MPAAIPKSAASVRNLSPLAQAEPEKTTPEPHDTPPTEAQKESKGDTEMPQPIEIFFSYAHEDAELRDELAKHLFILERQGKITTWYDGDIPAGSERQVEINTHLNSAHIILLLISPYFMLADEPYRQMKRALERYQTEQTRVIPIILRPTVGWNDEDFGKLWVLPREPKPPITSWPDRNEAFFHIVEEIQKIVGDLAARLPTPPKPAPTSTSGASTATSPQASAIEYNTGTIRNLLKAAFSDEDFTIFCFDNFREVHDQFSTGMSLTQKIQRLIEDCRKKMAFEKLFELVEKDNPVQYQRFADQLRR